MCSASHSTPVRDDPATRASVNLNRQARPPASTPSRSSDSGAELCESYVRLLCELHPIRPATSVTGPIGAIVSADGVDGQLGCEPNAMALEEGEMAPDAISREILDFLRAHLQTLFDRMPAVTKVCSISRLPSTFIIRVSYNMSVRNGTCFDVCKRVLYE